MRSVSASECLHAGVDPGRPVPCGTSPSQSPRPRHRRPSPRVDFKVVVWYRRDRPLETFKYQIYDLRKGEYTPAVDDWLELMRIEVSRPTSRVGPRRRPEPRERGDRVAQGGLGQSGRELTGRGRLEGSSWQQASGGRAASPNRFENQALPHRPGIAGQSLSPGTGAAPIGRPESAPYSSFPCAGAVSEAASVRQNLSTDLRAGRQRPHCRSPPGPASRA